MPCDHFGLGSLPRTRRAEQNETFFHSAAVKEDRHPANDEDGDGNIKPHQCALRNRFATTVGTARIKGASTNPAFAQKAVVMALNEMRLYLTHRIKHHPNDNEQARSAEKLGCNPRHV